MGDKRLIYDQKLELEKDRAALRNFKNLIYDAIQDLKNSQKYMDDAKTNLKKAYSSNGTSSKEKILTDKSGEITTIIKELQTSLDELNNKINSLNHQIEVKQLEMDAC